MALQVQIRLVGVPLEVAVNDGGTGEHYAVSLAGVEFWNPSFQASRDVPRRSDARYFNGTTMPVGVFTRDGILVASGGAQLLCAPALAG